MIDSEIINNIIIKKLFQNFVLFLVLVIIYIVCINMNFIISYFLLLCAFFNLNVAEY